MTLLKASLVSAAFALTFSIAPAARASNTAAGLALVFLTPLGHLTQMSGYASTIYYAVEDEKPMPIRWVVANIGTSLLGGSAGFVTMFLAFQDDVSKDKQIVPGIAGASLLTGSAVVITASVLQAARPSERPSGSRDTTLRSLVVLPAGGISPDGGSAAGLAIAGRF